MLENNIKNLIKILEESKVDELEISTFWGKQKIKIRKNTDPISQNNIETNYSNIPAPIANVPENNTEIPIALKTEEVAANADEGITSASIDKNTVIIKAPLVGTYYASAKPGTPPFIAEGDVIKTGQVICIIEAMKIFNEIESEISGKVVKILIKDGTPVEYDQDLIVISPE